jgi:hypothetical protein
MNDKNSLMLWDSYKKNLKREASNVGSKPAISSQNHNGPTPNNGLGFSSQDQMSMQPHAFHKAKTMPIIEVKSPE